MQKMVKEYVAEEVVRLHIKGRVLEIGSFDVNGNINDELKHCDHVRLDMRAGKNVDVVANSHSLPFPDKSFDAVVCVDTLEHDSAFWITMQEIDRVLKIGGALVLTVPGFDFVLHCHPNDYWRFTQAAVAALLEDYDNVETGVLGMMECFGSGSKQ